MSIHYLRYVITFGRRAVRNYDSWLLRLHLSVLLLDSSIVYHTKHICRGTQKYGPRYSDIDANRHCKTQPYTDLTNYDVTSHQLRYPEIPIGCRVEPTQVLRPGTMIFIR